MVRSLLQIIMKSVFVTTFYSPLYSTVGPKPFYSGKTLDWERLVYPNVLRRGYDTFICLIK